MKTQIGSTNFLPQEPGGDMPNLSTPPILPPPVKSPASPALPSTPRFKPIDAEPNPGSGTPGGKVAEEKLEPAPETPEEPGTTSGINPIFLIGAALGLFFLLRRKK